VVVGAVALVAGADPAAALRLGISMTALQASIGTVNDLVDVALDTGRKPGKPIPAGLVSIRGARIAAIGWAALGLGLAAVSGPALLALAGVVLGIGYGYDVWAKGTPWSWLPFALGIPILPVYGWYGATGALADWFLVLVPAAMVAGGSLAIANARADAERDASAGSGSIAVALGDGRAWLIHAIGLALVIVVATGWLVAAGGPIPPLALVLLAVGTATIASGVSLGQGTAAAARLERAWELEAVGVAILAIGWLWAVAG
jgi:geranylgeranylglycerol-phosphate geranylgeranyltransferase